MEDMATSALRDQDRLDGASNYAIWKAGMYFLIDENALKMHANNVVVEPTDVDLLKKFKVDMSKPKRMILYGVKDYVMCHIASKGNSKDMWDALATLYQGSSELRTLYVEQKLRSAHMQKGECVDPFLMKLKETHDELSAGDTHLKIQS